MATQPAIKNLNIWANRYEISDQFNFEEAVVTLDKHFGRSIYVGPLSLVLRHVITARSLIADREAVKAVAYYVACAVRTHAAGLMPAEYDCVEAFQCAADDALISRTDLTDAMKGKVLTDVNGYLDDAYALFREACELRNK